MKPQSKFALGVVMVCASASIPTLTIPMQLPLWQSLFVSVCCWIISWCGAAKATRAWYEIKRDDAAKLQTEFRDGLEAIIKESFLETVEALEKLK